MKYTVIGNVEMFVVVERHHDQQFERIEIGIFVYNNNNNNNININNKRGKEWREREREIQGTSYQRTLQICIDLRNVKAGDVSLEWMRGGGGAWREGGVRASK